MKESFILYKKYAKYVNKLNNEQAGELFKAIFAHEHGETMELCDPMTDLLFSMICYDLDYCAKKYAERCKKNSENGKKGGRPAAIHTNS